MVACIASLAGCLRSGSKETNWSQDTLLLGQNGLAALTFCEGPIDSP